MPARFPPLRASLAAGVGLALALLPVGCRSPRPLADDRTSSQAVVLVSLDGFRWDYPRLYPTPTLDRLAVRGARAEGLIPSFPSKTFPNHYTLVTGLYPGHHGIVANTMWDEALGRFGLDQREAVQDARWWGGEPIWVTAERRGLATAPLFWPGSEAPIGGIRPTHWQAYAHEMPGEERVRKLLDWLAGAAGEPVAFATLYFSDVDSAGHRHGPWSPQTGHAVERVDALLGLLVAGLEERRLSHVNVIVTSDHGMAPTSPERVIFLDEHLDLDRVRIVAWNPVVALDPRPGLGTDAVVAALDGSPHLRAYRREDTPAHWHYRDSSRVPAVVAVADEGWTITTRERFARHPEAARGGNHGYDPATSPTMRGIFYAVGPAFRPGARIEAFENVDVYALLCRLLGLEPRPHDGDPERLVALLSAEAAAPGQ